MALPDGWGVDRCGCGTCWDNHSPATRARAEALAVDFMWAATGRRFGLTELTVLPANPRGRDPLYQVYPVRAPWAGAGAQGAIYPVLDSGTWRNLGCGAGCCCTSRCEVTLPGPVADIVAVTVDSIEVDPGAYLVFDKSILARVDGDCWPTCQRFDTAIAGFEVTYHRGDPIPDNIQYATEQLACEFAAACTGGECRLPRQMTSLTRQGVQVTLDTVENNSGRIALARPLRTGIADIDDAISAVNPYGLMQQPAIYSPDMPANRVVTFRVGS